MLKFLNNSLEDIDDVIVDVANSMKLPEVIVEKDLYVSYILDYLFSRSEFKNYFEFKGGTSLSKGYGLINRFSEDIDVTIDTRLSQSQMRNVKKAIQEVVSELSIIILNANDIKSRRNYNKYLLS